jgi:hypothetical protein
VSTGGRIITLAVFGLGLCLTAWGWQPGTPIYTDLDRIFYLPDPDLEWRLVEDGRFLMGADLIGLSALFFIIAGALSQSEDRSLGQRIAWACAVAASVPALAAFTVGRFPDDARVEPPDGRGLIIVPDEVQGGLEGLEAGAWVSAEAGRGIVAMVPAGGETFETRFTLPQPASLTGNPSNLKQPLRMKAFASAASADTGVDGRSSSAREYLQAEKHPTIDFELIELTGAKASGDELEFAATGELRLMGETHEMPITGTLKILDAAARQRLGVEAKAAFLVRTNFPLSIEATALKAEASSFDGDTIDIQVELIFIPKYRY